MSDRLELFYTFAVDSFLETSRGAEMDLFAYKGEYVAVGPHGPNNHIIKMCRGINRETMRINYWAHSWDKNVGRPITLKFAEEVVKGWAAMKKAGEPV